MVEICPSLLKSHCIQVLKSSLSHDNWPELLLLGDVFSPVDLKRPVLAYVKQHWRDLQEREGWEEFFQGRPSLLRELVSAVSS